MEPSKDDQRRAFLVVEEFDSHSEGEITKADFLRLQKLVLRACAEARAEIDAAISDPSWNPAWCLYYDEDHFVVDQSLDTEDGYEFWAEIATGPTALTAIQAALATVKGESDG